MTTTGDVELTVLDGGAGTVVVPASSVAVVIGPCSGGVANQIYPSKDSNVLATAAGVGPGIEAAATLIAAGGTVLFVKSATTTPGALDKKSGSTVTGATHDADPIVITATAHELVSGDVVTIASVGGNTNANGTFPVTVIDADSFSIPVVGNDDYTSGGTVTPTGVNFQGAGTSIVGVTGTPLDSAFVKFLCTVGGTKGTTGIRFKISFDAGRNYGPEIALGTAASYAIAGTGLTLTFATGTLVAGDVATFATTEPLSSESAVNDCLTALNASPYAVTGWGSMLIVGARSGSHVTTIEGYLDTLAASRLFTRAIMNARDASPPTIYAGTGEGDATWAASVESDHSAVSAKRSCQVAGFYNLPGQFPIAAAGLPRYRRPGSWALAAREVTIQPQTHAGRVSDGAIAQIVVDPTNDPSDGFVYHDERTSPSLDAARFTSFRTRKGKPGFFVVNPNLMSPTGSVFTLLPLGNVMDIGCDLLEQTMSENVNADVRLNDNGTIDENAAQQIESVVQGVLRDQMLAKNMISDFTFSINRSTNVRTTSTVVFSATLYSRGYILEIDGTIGYGNTAGG